MELTGLYDGVRDVGASAGHPAKAVLVFKGFISFDLSYKFGPTQGHDPLKVIQWRISDISYVSCPKYLMCGDLSVELGFAGKKIPKPSICERNLPKARYSTYNGRNT